MEELYNVLWSIRTTAKSSTGESPFMLVYGSEAVLPIEVYEPTLRVMLYNEEDNWAALRHNLDLVPEIRGNALLRHQLYKMRMTRVFNRKVNLRSFKAGDLVLRKMEALGRANEEGKVTPNWEGPYKIAEVLREGTFKLETLDGKLLPRTWNADKLKKYYL